MPDAFDPYSEWLGILPEEQPPNHYRLLGIDLYEGDADKIAQAALARTETLRNYQLGKHSKSSQKILGEVARAKICLLDPEKKAAYDAEIGQRNAPTQAPDPPALEPEKSQGPPPTESDDALPRASKPGASIETEQGQKIPPRYPSPPNLFEGDSLGGLNKSQSNPPDITLSKEKRRVSLGVTQVVLSFLAIVGAPAFYFVITYETADSKVRSLLAEAEVKLQRGNLSEATQLAQQASNIEGANNLRSAKKLLNVIDDRQRAAAEAEIRAKQISERKAREEAERKAKEDAGRKAKIEAERKAKEDAERKAKIEAEREAKEDAERKAKIRAEREAKEDAKRKAKIEAERKAEADRNAKEEVESTIKFTYWPGGQKKSETHYKDGEQDGLSTEWHENGQKQIEANYKNGELDGIWTRWGPNGQRWSEYHYKNGERDGLWTRWGPNGQKLSEYHYKNGERDGLSTQYYNIGEKSLEGNYKNGKKHGLWTKWHDNGNKEYESYHKDGKEDGLWTYWDYKGNKIRRIQYKDGKEISRKEF